MRILSILLATTIGVCLLGCQGEVDTAPKVDAVKAGEKSSNDGKAGNATAAPLDPGMLTK